MWLIVAGEALAAILSLAPGVTQDRLVYFGLASLLIQWVSLSTLAALYVLRGRLDRLRPSRIAHIALGMQLVATWFIGGLAWSARERLLEIPASDWTMPALRLTGVSLVVGLLGLAIFQNHWRARQSAVRMKHAELEALQARTHPHFLFNSLNTAIALVHQRPEEAERVLLDLSDLFRSTLAGPRHIPIDEELGLVRRYLEIEQLRLSDRLDVRWELPPSLPAIDIPALSIQPLVENAVRHGVERRIRGGRIDIIVVADEDWLHATVRNDLPDASAAGAGSNGHGVGLPSVAGRIDAMTAGRGSLTTGSADGRFVASIRLPLDPAMPPGTAQVTTS